MQALDIVSGLWKNLSSKIEISRFAIDGTPKSMIFGCRVHHKLNGREILCQNYCPTVLLSERLNFRLSVAEWAVMSHLHWFYTVLCCTVHWIIVRLWVVVSPVKRLCTILWSKYGIGIREPSLHSSFLNWWNNFSVSFCPFFARFWLNFHSPSHYN